jgi:CTD small phosphatase-like protein 2
MALEFLKEMRDYYEIVIWTASLRDHADVVLDHLDPKHDLIDYRLYREHCLVYPGVGYVKDLRTLVNRSLQNTIIIDNSVSSFVNQLDNGIPVMPFFDSEKDSELRHLMDFLRFVGTLPDVRQVLNSIFQLKDALKHRTSNEWYASLVSP